MEVILGVSGHRGTGRSNALSDRCHGSEMKKWKMNLTDFGVIMVEVKVEMSEGDEFQRKSDTPSIGFGLFLYEEWSVKYKVLVEVGIFF
jgi:hypothetical protein